jgi:hypothetical protein
VTKSCSGRSPEISIFVITTQAWGADCDSTHEFLKLACISGTVEIDFNTWQEERVVAR